MKEVLLLLVVLLCQGASQSASLYDAAACSQWRERAAPLAESFRQRYQDPLGSFWTLPYSQERAAYRYRCGCFSFFFCLTGFGLLRSTAAIAMVRAALLGLVNVEEQRLWLQQFVNSHDVGQWTSDVKYDEASWMVEALVKVLPLASSNEPLARQMRNALDELGRYIYGSWDATCCLRGFPGGSWGNLENTIKTTTATAGSAIALTAIYGLNWNATLVERAQQMFEYWRLNFAMETGQVLGGITNRGSNADGFKDGEIVTVNQGMLVGAAVGLSRTNTGFLELVSPQVRFLIESEVTDAGVLRDEQLSAIYNADRAMWKGVAFRHLAAYAHTGFMNHDLEAGVKRTLSASADAIFGNTFNNTVMPLEWEVPSDGSVDTLSSQASALDAILAWTELVCFNPATTTTAVASTIGETKTSSTVPTSTDTAIVTVSSVSGNPTSTSQWQWTDPPFELTTPASGFSALFTWQTVVLVLMALVIVAVLGGVVLVLCMRRRGRRNAAAAGGLVAAEGFATEQEEEEDLFEDL